MGLAKHRADLLHLVDAPRPLWLDCPFPNNSVPLRDVKKVTDSLRLIKVDELTIQVSAPGEAFGNRKRRVQGCFRHAGREYSLWVTDPVCERHYLAKLNGAYRLGRCFLTISWGEPFQEHCYKLIAAVIEDK